MPSSHNNWCLQGLVSHGRCSVAAIERTGSKDALWKENSGNHFLSHLNARSGPNQVFWAWDEDGLAATGINASSTLHGNPHMGSLHGTYGQNRPTYTSHVALNEYHVISSPPQNIGTRKCGTRFGIKLSIQLHFSSRFERWTCLHIDSNDLSFIQLSGKSPRYVNHPIKYIQIFFTQYEILFQVPVFRAQNDLNRP